MTDREAAVQQVAGRLGLSPTAWKHAEIAAEVWWPLICQAREDGERAGREAEREDYARRSLEARGITPTVAESDYDRGRREAAEAIEAEHRDRLLHGNYRLSATWEHAARLARGAQQPDEKELTDGQ